MAWRVVDLNEVEQTTFAADYLNLSLDERRIVVHRLSREGRHDLVQQLLRLPLSDTERARLLSAADQQTAARLLPDLGDLIPSLASFAKRHSETMLAELRRRLTNAAPQVRSQIWGWAQPAAHQLAKRHPVELAQLLVDLGPIAELPAGFNRWLSLLIGPAPAQTTILLSRSSLNGRANAWQPRLRRGLRSRLRQLNHGQRVLLLRAASEDDYQAAAYLEALPPRDRAKIFTDAFAGINITNRVWEESLLTVLPHQLRQALARQMASLPAHQDSYQQLRLARFMAPPQAWDFLEPQLSATDASERSLAWESILTAAGLSRDIRQITRALGLLDRLASERDPVRTSAALAIAQIPSQCLAAVSLAPLHRFVQATVQAHDSSSATLHSLCQTAWRLFTHQAQRGLPVTEALDLLVLLARSQPDLPVPDLPIPSSGVGSLADRLRPVMDQAASRNHYWLVFSLYQRLGRRAWHQVDLNEFLFRALSAPEDHVQRLAVRHWLADPKTRGDRLEVLLQRDESYACLDDVQSHICRFRTDLVSVFYRATALQGRFWNGDKPYVPLLAGPFWAWLPDQIRAYSGALHRFIASSQTEAWVQAAAIQLLGRLPGLGPQALTLYLGSEDPSQVEAALRAVSYTQQPEAALPLLLAHRGTDLARTAMYVLSRVIRAIPPLLAETALRQAADEPSAKVTSRKEIIRLLGMLRTPHALPTIVSLGADEQTHRDIRIAAGRAALNYLDDERAWELLTKLASTDRAISTSLTLTVPEQLAARHQARFAALLIPSHPEPDLVHRLKPWVAIAPELIGSITDLIVPSQTPVCQAAIEVMRHFAAVTTDWQVPLSIVERLARAAIAEEEPDAQEYADLPHRQVLEQLLAALIPKDAQTNSYHRPRLNSLAELLSRYPDMASWEWSARLAATNWTDPAESWNRLANQVTNPTHARELVEMAATALAAAQGARLASGLDQTADQLIDRDDVSATALALVIVQDAGKRSGWTEPWRARLRTLRHHRNTAVAMWARSTYTSS